MQAGGITTHLLCRLEYTPVHTEDVRTRGGRERAGMHTTRKEMHTTRKEMHTTRTAKESRSKLSKWHATVFTSNQGETHRDTQRHTETHRDTQRHTEDGCIGGGLDARVTADTH